MKAKMKKWKYLMIALLGALALAAAPQSTPPFANAKYGRQARSDARSARKGRLKHRDAQWKKREQLRVDRTKQDQTKK
jgi:hypothetical protein